MSSSRAIKGGPIITRSPVPPPAQPDEGIHEQAGLSSEIGETGRGTFGHRERRLRLSIRHQFQCPQETDASDIPDVRVRRRGSLQCILEHVSHPPRPGRRDRVGPFA